jgi:hypothetical protein
VGRGSRKVAKKVVQILVKHQRAAPMLSSSEIARLDRGIDGGAAQTGALVDISDAVGPGRIQITPGARVIRLRARRGSRAALSSLRKKNVPSRWTVKQMRSFPSRATENGVAAWLNLKGWNVP